jgi:hypothetical protein
MGVEINGILGLLWLIVIIWAVIQVAQSSASGTSKLLWIIVLLLLPVLGLILWFFLGPKSSKMR